MGCALRPDNARGASGSPRSPPSPQRVLAQKPAECRSTLDCFGLTPSARRGRGRPRVRRSYPSTAHLQCLGTRGGPRRCRDPLRRGRFLPSRRPRCARPAANCQVANRRVKKAPRCLRSPCRGRRRRCPGRRFLRKCCLLLLYQIEGRACSSNHHHPGTAEAAGRRCPEPRSGAQSCAPRRKSAARKVGATVRNSQLLPPGFPTALTPRSGPRCASRTRHFAMPQPQPRLIPE
jgi:hypothetical protein